MKKVILFGSKLCDESEPMKAVLSGKNIKFAYLDITESLFNLKLFLKYRDVRDEFKRIRDEGSVGIPSIIINKGEKILFELNEDTEI